MKVVLAGFLAFVALVVAEDVFFYDKQGANMIHRVVDTCYVLHLTQDQQDNLIEHTDFVHIQQLMTDLATNSSNVSPLPQEDVTAFITHHCHNRELLLVSQP